MASPGLGVLVPSGQIRGPGANRVSWGLDVLEQRVATRLRVSSVCAPAGRGRDGFENSAAAARMRLGISRSFLEKETSFSTVLVAVSGSRRRSAYMGKSSRSAHGLLSFPLRKPENRPVPWCRILGCRADADSDAGGVKGAPPSGSRRASPERSWSSSSLRRPATLSTWPSRGSPPRAPAVPWAARADAPPRDPAGASRSLAARHPLVQDAALRDAHSTCPCYRTAGKTAPGPCGLPSGRVQITGEETRKAARSVGRGKAETRPSSARVRTSDAGCVSRVHRRSPCKRMAA